MIDSLTREIWNELIAKPKNIKGDFQLSPGKLRKIIEKHLIDYERRPTTKSL